VRRWMPRWLIAPEASRCSIRSTVWGECKGRLARRPPIPRARSYSARGQENPPGWEKKDRFPPKRRMPAVILIKNPPPAGAETGPGNPWSRSADPSKIRRRRGYGSADRARRTTTRRPRNRDQLQRAFSWSGSMSMSCAARWRVSRKM
jgi:hypothetical protein